MQQDPISEHIENHYAQQNTNVANEYHVDKVNVGCFNAYVNHRF